MKKNLRFLILTLLCAVFSVAWGEDSTSTLTFTAACGGSGTADDGVAWTVTSDAKESTFDNTRGIHYGTGSVAVSYLQLSTSGISGTIKKVVVNASGASNTSANLEVKVGNEAFGDKKDLSSSSVDYEFTGSARGPIVVRLSQTSAKKALYVKSIVVTYTLVPAISVDKTNIELTSAAKQDIVSVDYTLVDPENAEVRFFESDGTTSATYNWIEAELNQEGNISYSVDENTGSAARTAYLKVYGLDGSANGVYSQLITITQKKPALDYAVLPFVFNGKSSDIASTDGLSQSGLGDDYSNAPYLKFDSEGDYLVLKINEAPGVLSFDIKGNPSSGSFSGTMTIETSVDGTEYVSSRALTAPQISTTKNTVEITDLPTTARYIRWYFTKKSNGNIGLGNISLAEHVVSITVDDAPFEFDSEDHNGKINVAYNGFVPSRTDVYFYESNGTTSASYDWIDFDFDNDKNITYLIRENEGNTARTAYFKVFALDADDNEVYSDLITITQSKPVVDYAVLPFAFNEGSSAIASTEGLTQDGLGAKDYGTATTKLKFDDDGDYVILHFNEKPGILTFDVKANGSGSTFTSTMTLTASADGTTYSYSKELSSDDIVGTEETNTITITNLPATARYIKWEMNKETGNIGMGNIHLYKPTVIFTDDGEDNTDIISANEGLANVMLGGRTLVKGGSWNTLCLPFNVDLTDKDGVLYGATAKTLTDATMEGTHVTLNFGSDITEELVAGTPYIIKWDDSGDNIVNPLFMNVNIVEAEPATINKADGCVQFKGYYDAFDITAENNSNIYYMTAGSKLKHTGKDRTLNAFRAYFVFTAEAEALEFTMDFGDGTTVIQGAELNLDTESGAWYTIDGRRLNAEPTAKGVYIHNGQKMIIK